jgi:hypothetical protein
MTVPRSKLPPKKCVYSDGAEGVLTEAEWLALPLEERQRIEKLVDEHIKKLQRHETL